MVLANGKYILAIRFISNFIHTVHVFAHFCKRKLIIAISVHQLHIWRRKLAKENTHHVAGLLGVGLMNAFSVAIDFWQKGSRKERGSCKMWNALEKDKGQQQCVCN